MPGSLSIGPHGIAVRASLVCVAPPGQGRGPGDTHVPTLSDLQATCTALALSL